MDAKRPWRSAVRVVLGTILAACCSPREGLWLHFGSPGDHAGAILRQFLHEFLDRFPGLPIVPLLLSAKQFEKIIPNNSKKSEI